MLATAGDAKLLIADWVWLELVVPVRLTNVLSVTVADVFDGSVDDRLLLKNFIEDADSESSFRIESFNKRGLSVFLFVALVEFKSN